MGPLVPPVDAGVISLRFLPAELMVSVVTQAVNEKNKYFEEVLGAFFSFSEPHRCVWTLV